jgi:hypothetical protein
MKRTVRLLALILSVGSAGLIGRAVAQETQKKPCAADAARLCKGVPFGTGEVMQCLKQHAAELSPQCKMHMAQMSEKKQGKEMEMEKSAPPPQEEPAK